MVSCGADAMEGHLGQPTDHLPLCTSSPKQFPESTQARGNKKPARQTHTLNLSYKSRFVFYAYGLVLAVIGSVRNLEPEQYIHCLVFGLTDLDFGRYRTVYMYVASINVHTNRLFRYISY